MGHLLRWLSPEEPLFELRPFPPPNEYGKLRPWDRRDQPTMELFPLTGRDISLAVVFNYMHLSYHCDLVLRPPGGGRPRRIIDVWVNKDLEPEARIEDDEVILPLRSSAGRDMYFVVIEWT